MAGASTAQSQLSPFVLWKSLIPFMASCCSCLWNVWYSMKGTYHYNTWSMSASLQIYFVCSLKLIKPLEVRPNWPFFQWRVSLARATSLFSRIDVLCLQAGQLVLLTKLNGNCCIRKSKIADPLLLSTQLVHLVFHSVTLPSPFWIFRVRFCCCLPWLLWIFVMGHVVVWYLSDSDVWLPDIFLYFSG